MLDVRYVKVWGLLRICLGKRTHLPDVLMIIIKIYLTQTNIEAGLLLSLIVFGPELTYLIQHMSNHDLTIKAA